MCLFVTEFVHRDKCSVIFILHPVAAGKVPHSLLCQLLWYNQWRVSNQPGLQGNWPLPPGDTKSHRIACSTILILSWKAIRISLRTWDHARSAGERTHQNMPNVFICSFKAAEANTDPQEPLASPHIAGCDRRLSQLQCLATVHQHLDRFLHINLQNFFIISVHEESKCRYAYFVIYIYRDNICSLGLCRLGKIKPCAYL